MVVLVDTREKSNSHIIEWLDKKKIPYKLKALSNGDYSFYVPANPNLNIDRDLFFDSHIMIERKGSLEELSSNFSQHRARFEEEMATYSQQYAKQKTNERNSRKSGKYIYPHTVPLLISPCRQIQGMPRTTEKRQSG